MALHNSASEPSPLPPFRIGPISKLFIYHCLTARGDRFQTVSSNIWPSRPASWPRKAKCWTKRSGNGPHGL